ncbi:hypothetical protein [Dehalococcoides mccartyi]|uniref:hypothetical protein n=1 Tax=Dehalococcoides mccartyi TaxID=61435 RepID=UPI0008058942|nr:hypothetical protein [Dehalococcoides mccartyi]OBW61905.1 MAG: hypothetical protein A9181_02695 [Dehalococcoides mccartyi]
MSLLIKSSVTRLSGNKGTINANWYAGIGSSGETGGDVVTIGILGKFNKVQALWLNIENLVNGAIVTVRLYHSINNIEKKVHEQSFTRGIDPDGLWIISGAMEISGTLRCELKSDNSGDTAKDINWEWVTE